MTTRHDNAEVLFLVKLILGVAMKSEKNNEMINRITSLDKQTQDTLMQLIKEVLASMQPEEAADSKDDDDAPLKTFDEILQEYPDMNDVGEEDWNDWEDDTPVEGASGLSVCPSRVDESGFHDYDMSVIEEKGGDVDAG